MLRRLLPVSVALLLLALAFLPAQAQAQVFDLGDTFTLTVASNGVAKPLYDTDQGGPSAVYFNGTTYIVWQGDPNTLDPYISSYNSTSDTMATPVLVDTNPLTDDYHGSPKLAVPDDGILHVFFGEHGTPIEYARSDSPEDITAWTTQPDAGGAGIDATYVNAVTVGSDIYLFYRQGAAPPEGLAYLRSTDGGASWGSPTTIVISTGVNVSYPATFEYDSSGQIHFAWRRFDGTVARWLHYAKFNVSDGVLFSVNNTNLGTSINESEAENYTLVDSLPSGGHMTSGSIHLDENDDPYIINSLRTSLTGGWNATFYRWTGSTWTSREIIADQGDADGYSDFIVHSSSNVEALINTEGASGYGGDLRLYTWNGLGWTAGDFIGLESATGNALSNPKASVDYPDAGAEVKFFFSEVDVLDFGNADLRVYAYGQNATSVSFVGEATTWLLTYGSSWVTLLAALLIFGVILSSFYTGIKKRRRSGKIWKFLPRKWR